MRVLFVRCVLKIRHSYHSGRLAGKENINIHSILPMHQVANILPSSLAEVDLFELHASANFLDLLKLANMLLLNDIVSKH